MSNVLKTKRLIMKQYEDTDQKAMIDLLTNQIIKESFMIPDFQTEKEAVLMFKKLQEFSCSQEHYERGIYIEHQLIGFVNDVEIDEGVIELGYVIHPDYHNKGYATESLKAAIEDLFGKGFRQIVAGAFESNAASINVMKKCGMKKIEREEDIYYQGEMQHCHYYSVLNDDK